VKIKGCVILLSYLMSAAAWAQSTAQIHGSVLDPAGAAVPDAEVNATQLETGVSRSISSTADGGFVLTNLPLGPYQVQVSKEGFATSLNKGIVLQVGSNPALTITLQVGATSQQVNVEANVLLVETRSLAVGEVVQTQRVVDLPLNGRNVTDLIGLAGASVQTGSAQTRWFSNQPIISIGGSPAVGGAGGTSLLGTEYSLDGANHLNFLSGGVMPIAFPDAVQEFRTETSGQTAERGAATSVSIVTRSGTNTFHGSLFEFIRNSAFGSAREVFSPATVTTPYKRNQFGGTLGGPIKRDKLFFFGGYQGSRVRQTVPRTTVIPTAAMMAGDWSTFASAACNGGTAKTLRTANGTINNLSNAAGNFSTSGQIAPS